MVKGLTKKTIAAPKGLLTHPFQVELQYGEPEVFETVAKAVAWVRAKLLDLDKRASIYCKADQPAIAELANSIGEITIESLPITVSGVVDSYTGTKFVATFSDRRVL